MVSSMAKVQIIDPREHGQRPLNLKMPVFDEGAVSRADDALKSMSGSFEQWLDNDSVKLQAARVEAQRLGWSDESLEVVLRGAHDLKGMGATYGYPLVTQLGASLCRLIETEAGKQASRANPALVNAHVDALRAVIRDRITTDAHPLGRAIVRALEAHVAALGVAPR